MKDQETTPTASQSKRSSREPKSSFEQFLQAHRPVHTTKVTVEVHTTNHSTKSWSSRTQGKQREAYQPEPQVFQMDEDLEQENRIQQSHYGHIAQRFYPDAAAIQPLSSRDTTPRMFSTAAGKASIDSAWAKESNYGGEDGLDGHRKKRDGVSHYSKEEQHPRWRP